MLHGLVTSDWHFDGLRNHFPEDHASIVAREVRKVYQYAVDNGIKYIFVPGDISDNYRMTPESQRAILSILVEYDEIVETYYMMGNHDFGDVTATSLDLFDSMSDFKMLKTFRIIRDRKQLTIGKVRLNFCPFPHKSLLPSDIPCINFIHQDVNGAVGDNGRPLRTRHDIELDPRSFTFAGHIHKFQYLKDKRVLFGGNLYQKNFGESLPKYFIEFKAKVVDNKLKLKWEAHENVPNFKLETVHINTQEEFSKLVADKYIRYRVYVADGVVVPKNLRKDIPNIDQLWEFAGKKLKKNDQDVVNTFIQESKELPKINPTTGLASYFKSQKLSKQDYLLGKAAVEAALENIFSQT